MTNDAPLFAGVELGGTKCVCILATGADDVREIREVPTRAPGQTLAAIEAVLDEWRGFDALGIGSFGPLDLDRTSPLWGHIVTTPKPGWSGASVAPRLSARYKVATGFETDVAGAALAEGRWGAGRDLESFAYVTVGTGIGVGIVCGGRAVRGLGHPEAGHMRLPRAAGDAWPGSCPHHGDCAEGLASGSAIEARLGRRGGTLTADDPVWELVSHTLAALFHDLVLTTAPQRIIVGGGVPNRQPHLLDRVRRDLIASLAGYAQGRGIAETIDQFVVPPALGDRAGPLGSIALADDALASMGL